MIKETSWRQGEGERVLVDLLNSFAREVASDLNRQSPGLSVRGVTDPQSGPEVDIVGVAGGVLRVNDAGDSLGFGKVSIASLAVVPSMDRARTAVQNVPGTGAATPIVMDTTQGVAGGTDAPTASTNGIRISRRGRYLVTGVIRLDAAANGSLEMLILINGIQARAVASALVATRLCEISIAWPMKLLAGDDVTLSVSQNTGAAIATFGFQHGQPAISVTYLGDA